jgi:hypothetical protein
MSQHDRVSRIYRGHRIVIAWLGSVWHAVVHDPRGSILVGAHIEGRTMQDAMARAEWAVETRLAFSPPPRQRASWGLAREGGDNCSSSAS